MRIVKCIIILVLAVGLAAAVWLPSGEHVMGSYVTSLKGRTRGQRMNAERAARALDGVVIESGQTFSFNQTVGSWSPDRGYVLAPVSYDGELVVDWGGGVCQTSSTLYNAALIAGLEVIERHRHTWAPTYVPPGHDAAVAQVTIDLRLRNPFSFPVRLHALADGGRIGFRILGRQPGPIAAVDADILAAEAPVEVVKPDADGSRRIVTHGRPGTRVALYRTFLRGPRAGQRDLVSQDAYPAMHRVVTTGR